MRRGAAAGGFVALAAATDKTIILEAAANTADLALFAVFFGGGAGTAAGLFVVNTATAGTVNYTHETVWGLYGSELDAGSETRPAIEKTGTHRIVSAARNLALGSTFGGTFAASVAFTAAGQTVDTVPYPTNETPWVRYGPRVSTS